MYYAFKERWASPRIRTLYVCIMLLMYKRKVLREKTFMFFAVLFN